VADAPDLRRQAHHLHIGMNLLSILTANPTKERAMRIVFETSEPDDPSAPDDDTGNGNGDEEEGE
jgi:hypothetical protein